MSFTTHLAHPANALARWLSQRRRLTLLAPLLLIGAAPPTPDAGRPLRIVALGDSLTAQGYPELVGQRFNLPVVNLGIGGQRADAITARYGAIPIHVTITGGRILAGENHVELTAPEIFRTKDQIRRTMRVTIAGVTGTYVRTAAGSPTVDTDSFVPDPGQSLPAVAPPGTRMVPEPTPAVPDILLICVGRNNRPSTLRANEAMIDAIIAKHRPNGDRVLLLGVPNAALPSEVRGMPDYNAIVAFNADLARRYPDAFIDMQRLLNAAGDPNSPADRADRAQDFPPTSLRVDNIHYNDAGRRFWANVVEHAILKKKWL